MTQLLNTANGRLKRDRVRVRIVTRGDRLYLRATLPPVPGSTKLEPFQQRIALGLPCTREGILKAETRARRLGIQLIEKSFNWSDWGRVSDADEHRQTVSDWVKAFEKDYFSRRSTTAKTVTTWRYDYEKIFKKLPADLPLSAELILQACLDTAPDTRTRQRACRILSALARFSGISIDLNRYQGHYNQKSVELRAVPPDALILEWRDRLADQPEWQWVYGILAAYGIRPSEILHCKIDFPRLDILDGKTQSRTCYPLPKDWAIDWDLEQARLPKISGRSNTDVGSRVTHAFKRLGIPFPPKMLRHAWSIRAIDYLPVEIAARQQGHSLDVHIKTYQRWLDDRRFRQFFE